MKALIVILVCLFGCLPSFSQGSADDLCACVVNPFSYRANRKIKDAGQRVSLFSHYLNDLGGAYASYQIVGKYHEVFLYLNLDSSNIGALRKVFAVPYLQGDTVSYYDYGKYYTLSEDIGHYVFWKVLPRGHQVKYIQIYLHGKKDKRQFHARIGYGWGGWTIEEARFIDFHNTPRTYWRSNKSKIKALFNNSN